MPKIKIQNKAQTTGQKSESFGRWKIWVGTLNKLLEEFYASVRKKDGEDKERDIFRVLIIVVDRYLIDEEYKNSIVRDGEFKSSDQILGKTSTTPAQGKGKRPNQWAMTRKKNN